MKLYKKSEWFILNEVYIERITENNNDNNNNIIYWHTPEGTWKKDNNNWYKQNKFKFQLWHINLPQEENEKYENKNIWIKCDTPIYEELYLNLK
jgi:hypothetical protein